MTTVITGWSPSGWHVYGKRFVETFDKFWPREYALHVFVEEFADIEINRTFTQTLLKEIPGCMEFIEEYRFNAEANGKMPKPNWKDSAKASGYNFRFDAWKFCRQAYIPLHAAQHMKSGLMCWLDGDVVSHARVPSSFLEGMLPKGRHVAYLGREPKHSEIGFQLYRVPEAMGMLQEFRDIYDSRQVFDLKEWHSAYVFDEARRRSEVPSHNLTPGGTGNVWQQSPLAAFSDHLKGKRKGVVR